MKNNNKTWIPWNSKHNIDFVKRNQSAKQTNPAHVWVEHLPRNKSGPEGTCPSWGTRTRSRLFAKMSGPLCLTTRQYYALRNVHHTERKAGRNSVSVSFASKKHNIPRHGTKCFQTQCVNVCATTKVEYSQIEGQHTVECRCRLRSEQSHDLFAAKIVDNASFSSGKPGSNRFSHWTCQTRANFARSNHKLQTQTMNSNDN